MDAIMILGGLIIIAYLLQFFLGLQQIKHFNHVYTALRRLGRVAIGRRSGKLKAGTIVMFAITPEGLILKAEKMQGLTIAAHFKEMPAYIGEDLHYLDDYHPLVRKENKLLRAAIADARYIFLLSDLGQQPASPLTTPSFDLSSHIKVWTLSLKQALTKKRRKL